MADIPSNLSYGTVTGRFLLAYADSNDSGLNPDAVPAQGTVYFTPSPNYIKDPSATPAPVTILPASIECQLDSEGYVVGYGTDRGVRLLATDDPQGNPVDWTWSVNFRLTDASGTPVRTIPDFSFELPAGTTVDLTDATPVPDANGTYYLVGPTGPANSLSIGTVTTGAAGSSADATITGTAPSQTLSLTIPRGDKGEKGDKGDTGDQGPIGETGATGLNWQGEWSNTVNYINDDAVYHNSSSWFASGDPTVGEEPTLTATHWYPLALQGATGNTGPANVLSVGTVTTGSAGSSAAVTITGTSPTQTVNFTIPRGDKGEKGDTGEQGPAGSLSTLSATAPIMYNSGTSTLSFDSTYLASIDGGTA
jgi:hypothetical protein